MKFNNKRRKDKYNPYTLECTKNEYKVKFKGINNENNYIKLSKKICEEFNKFELEDISQMNKFDRHIEHSKLREATLNKRINVKQVSVEDIIIERLERQSLYKAIIQLPETQKRRIIMYYFKELTQSEIAKIEKASIRAIQYSLKRALINLKKILK